MIRELIHGVLEEGGKQSQGRQERWEEEPSAPVLLGKEALTHGEERSNEDSFPKTPLFTVQ